jgi:hypothetical protein
MDELFDDLNQDSLLQGKIKHIMETARDPAQLQETIASILNSELDDIRVHIHSQVKEMTTDSFEKQLSVLVASGIQEIDSVIKGTTDQAIEMVMKATRSERPATANTAPNHDPIHTVTPQRTFRGMNVRIDESPTPGPTAFKSYNQTEHDKYNRQHDLHSPPTQRYGSYEDYGPNRSRTNTRDDDYRHREPEEFTHRDQEYFLKGYIEATLENLLEDHVIVWYKSVDSYCTLHNVPLLSFQQVGKGIDLYPADAPAEHRERFSRMLSIKLNQSSLIKDPIAKSIINARAGRDDGYGALYALLAASIPRLQIHKIVPAAGSNKPPTWEPTVVNLYHYESKILDYIEHQATKNRFYSDREVTQFFLEGIATDDTKRFASALAKALDKLEKIPETQNLPMDYRIGQIAQTIAELAISDPAVGTDALLILGEATVCTTIGGAMVNYTRGEEKGKQAKDGPDRRKRFRRPKVEIQCPGCKLWGHEDTTCDFLARTLFALDYTKKNTEKAEKIAEAFCRKNSKEAKAFIKTLSAFPSASRPPHDHHIEQDDDYNDDNDGGEDYFVEDFLGSMISGFGLSIKTAAVSTDHNKTLLEAVDPLALQCIHLLPFPEIAPPPTAQPTPTEEYAPVTIPVVCKIYTQATPAQADSGANRAITDNASLLHNLRQLDKPFPVGSIDADNKIYCTAIGELQLLTEEGGLELFPCFYCAQSAGTVISPDHKCTTSGHIMKWEQEGDTRTGRGAIRFRNPQNDIVATLPTFRRNGLWYTELAAVPPADTQPTVHALIAPPGDLTQDDYFGAFTDSDRHHTAQ